MSVRRPSVAGAFYPAKPGRLKKLIENCFNHTLGPGSLPSKRSQNRNILSIVSPHAGYIYSGPSAAHGYFNLAEQKKPDTIIILGPNHTGWGSPISMMGEGAWETPLGHVPINEDLAKEIFNKSELIDLNETAHTREHSIEVQLPFLQYIYGDFKFIPICMGIQDLETSKEIGKTLAKIGQSNDILIIASSDLSHQETQETANRKDKLVLDSILGLDEIELQRQIFLHRITACGYGPISTAVVASKLLGAQKAELLSYYTSGDIIGQYSGVVGYASVKISK
jgi:hypothetical protein